MIAEAVAVAKEKYDIDFSIFDTDGDGLVDNVYIASPTPVTARRTLR